MTNPAKAGDRRAHAGEATPRGGTRSCASIVDLLNRMKEGASTCHRTLRLSPVTDQIWSVPNFGPPKKDSFDRVRIEYSPQSEDMQLTENPERLVLRLGASRVNAVSAAFAEVSVGLGDFGIATSDDPRPDIWMFWWMLPDA
jgi:hypothetical protein